MMLTVDEYMDLRRLLSSEKESEGATLEARIETPKPKRKTTRYQKELGKQLENQNKLHRLKNGSLRKGKTASSLLKAAHKLTKLQMK